MQNSHSKETNFYYLGSPNGVGKTTILNEIKTNYPEFQLVHGASALMQQLGLRPGDYDSLRLLTRNVKAEAFGDLIADLARQQDGRSKIVDTHFAVMILGRIEYNKDEPWITDVDALVLLTAPVDQVFARIAGDIRDRKLFPPNSTLQECKNLYRRFVWRSTRQFNLLAKNYKKPKIIVNNAQDRVEVAVQMFYQQHQQLLISKNRVF